MKRSTALMDRTLLFCCSRYIHAMWLSRVDLPCISDFTEFMHARRMHCRMHYRMHRMVIAKSTTTACTDTASL